MGGGRGGKKKRKGPELCRERPRRKRGKKVNYLNGEKKENCHRRKVKCSNGGGEGTDRVLQTKWAHQKWGSNRGIGGDFRIQEGGPEQRTTIFVKKTA